MKNMSKIFMIMNRLGAYKVLWASSKSSFSSSLLRLERNLSILLHLLWLSHQIFNLKGKIDEFQVGFHQSRSLKRPKINIYWFFFEQCGVKKFFSPKNVDFSNRATIHSYSNHLLLCNFSIFRALWISKLDFITVRNRRIIIIISSFQHSKHIHLNF